MVAVPGCSHFTEKRVSWSLSLNKGVSLAEKTKKANSWNMIQLTFMKPTILVLC
jgi:hypothetical protein